MLYCVRSNGLSTFDQVRKGLLNVGGVLGRRLNEEHIFSGCHFFAFFNAHTALRDNHCQHEVLIVNVKVCWQKLTFSARSSLLPTRVTTISCVQYLSISCSKYNVRCC